MSRWAPRLCGALALLSGVVACNAIVGVETVKLKKTFEIDGGEEEDTGIPPPDDDGGPTDPNELEVALGTSFTCARKPDGTVRCWGDDTSGQLGAGLSFDGGTRPPATSPQPVVGVSDARRIAAGARHACIVRTSGQASCWGDGVNGQLGNAQSNARSAVPVTVVGLGDATRIAAGGNFTCAVRRGGDVACWGGNTSGQLGTGNRDERNSPTAVASLNTAADISAGEAHACAVTTSGAVFCWGDNLNGQLGNGRVEPAGQSRPVSVPGLSDIVQVSAAARSTCALERGGAVSCWGANESGQLGTGAPNQNPNPSPALVPGISDAVSIWAGDDHACAARRTGAVVCWGASGKGQIGAGPTVDGAALVALPLPVAGIGNAIAVSTGGAHSCAPLESGAIFCWGENDRGQLGDRSQQNAFSPVAVRGYP